MIIYVINVVKFQTTICGKSCYKQYTGFVNAFKSNLDNSSIIYFKCSVLDCGLNFVEHQQRKYILIDFKKYNSESIDYFSLIQKNKN